MMVLQLKTVGQSEKGTWGVLVNNQVPFALTLELPWRDNQHNVSCIPAGVYTCKRIVSLHFGDTFEITGVPDRTNILLHKANTLADLKGCVGVGEKFEGTYEDPVLADSRLGYDEFMRLMTGINEFSLEIIR